MAPPGGGGGDDGGGGENSKKPTTFRWFDAVRYVVALVVGVLTVLFISYAVVVVLHPGELLLTVAGRSVSAERITTASSSSNSTSAASWSYRFSVHLHAASGSPTSRLRLSYTDIAGRIAPQAKPEQDFVLDFRLDDDVYVDQLSTVDTYAQVYGGGAMVESYVRSSSYSGGNGRSNGTTRDDEMLVFLRLNGTLTVELYSWHRISRPAIYYCLDLTIVRGGGGTSDHDTDGDTAGGDLKCMETSPPDGKLQLPR